MARRRRPLAERFAEKIEDAPSGCVVWRGHHQPDGKPVLTDYERPVSARRIAVELAGVTIPAGCVVSRCPADPSCVRVDHLRVLSRSDLVRLIVWQTRRERAA